MSEYALYVSRVRVESVKGPVRRAYIPAREEPIYFGLHSEVAELRGMDPTVHEPHALTFDYLVAAVAG